MPSIASVEASPRAALPRALPDRARQPRPARDGAPADLRRGRRRRLRRSGAAEPARRAVAGRADLVDCAPSSPRWRSARRGGSPSAGDACSRRAGAGQAAALDGARSTSRRAERRAPLWRLLGAGGGPVRCNATLVAGEPARSPPRAALGAGRLPDLQDQGRRGATTSPRCARSARRSGPQAQIRIDANAAWDVDEATRTLAELEPLGIELAEQPWRRWRRRRRSRGATAIPLVADESVATAADAERAVALGAFALHRGQAREGRRARGGAGDRRDPARLLSSALDGPVGIAAGCASPQSLDARTPGRRRGLAHGLATQRLFAATIAADESSCAATSCTPPGPGLGVEIDEDALDARLSEDLADDRHGPDQPQHRARLGPRRGAGARRAAAGGRLPRLALDARSRWRSGASRGSRSTVILDERSAGFVALGAALATGEPVALACTSGTAAANLHPAIGEADEAGVPLIVLTSDRPPELRGDRRRADDRSDQPLRLRRALVLRSRHPRGRRRLASCTMRSVACRALAEARGESAGPVHLNLPWREPLGPEPRPRARSPRPTRSPLEGRDGERPLTAVTARRPEPTALRARRGRGAHRRRDRAA